MNRFFKIRLILFFYYCLFFCFPTAATALFIDSPHPPPGFAAVSTSQHVRISLFFMQRYVGIAYVNIHNGQLTFHSPELVGSN